MLTAKEQQTLEFIEQYFLKHNYAPTAAEIADGIGIHSRGVVHRYLRALERAGYLELVAGRRRNIRMCSQQHKPWVLPMVGQIAAGLPIEAIEQECSVDLRSRPGCGSATRRWRRAASPGRARTEPPRACQWASRPGHRASSRNSRGPSENRSARDR